MKDQFEKTVVAEMRLHESVLGWHVGAYTNQYTQCLFKGFCIAWQHRQGEVDKLTKQRDSFIKAYEIEINKSIELQKRVDILTFTMNELLDDLKYPTATFEEVVGCSVNVLEQALKGESNESST